MTTFGFRFKWIFPLGLFLFLLLILFLLLLLLAYEYPYICCFFLYVWFLVSTTKQFLFIYSYECITFEYVEKKWHDCITLLLLLFSNLFFFCLLLLLTTCLSTSPSSVCPSVHPFALLSFKFYCCRLLCFCLSLSWLCEK